MHILKCHFRVCQALFMSTASCLRMRTRNRELAYSFKKLVSRAYHDALFMSQICPSGMIFIPSQNGYSHRPEEYSSPEDIARGAKVLALTMAKLSES